MLQLFFVLVAAVSLFMTFRYFNLARHLLAIPRASIRSAPQGYIEITGRAKPLVPVPYHAPGTSEPCVWFECTYRQQRGDSSTEKIKQSGSSFLLDDGTGQCRIDPRTMQIETRSEKSFHIGGETRDGLVSTRWIGIDEKIHAYGRFDTLSADFHQQKKDMIRQRLGQLKRDRVLMSRFDSNADGDVDAAEWERAREFVEQDVETYFDGKQKEIDQSDAIHVLRRPEDDRMPFLVSSHDELRNVRRFRLFAFGFLALFILAMSALFDPQLQGWIDLQIDKSLQPP